MTYASLNKDLTNIMTYPGTNFSLTTRAIRKVVTSFCQRDAPDMAEELANLLCHDPATTKRYYDLSRGEVSAATRAYDKLAKFFGSITTPKIIAKRKILPDI